MVRTVKPKRNPPKKKTPAAAAANEPEEEELQNVEETEEIQEGASDTSSTTRKRQDRKLSDKDEVTLLEFLKLHTCMWDMKELQYRNAELKNSLWEQLAKDMGGGVTSGHLKAAFKNLRNWYTKLDKEASKSGTAPRVLTGRDVQVQERMQFMKQSVTHRPAPLFSTKTGGPNASQTSELIRSLDDQALLQPAARSPSSKKRRPSAASGSASTSVDADTLEGLETAMSRNTSTLDKIYSSVHIEDEADRVNPNKAIYRSFCQYVTSCVMTFDETEFDEFQSSFTLLNERFKAQRREAQRRANALQHRSTAGIPTDTHFGYPSSHTISQTSAPVPFHLYPSDSHQYQSDPSQWLSQTPTSLQGSSLYQSQSNEFIAQYRFLQQRQSGRVQQPQAAPPPPPQPTLPLQPQPELPLITRLHSTSMPKRPKPSRTASADQPQQPGDESAETSATDLNFSEFSIPAEQDSQQDALDQLG